jgi:hypothetical protein
MVDALPWTEDAPNSYRRIKLGHLCRWPLSVVVKSLTVIVSNNRLVRHVQPSISTNVLGTAHMVSHGLCRRCKGGDEGKDEEELCAGFP